VAGRGGRWGGGREEGRGEQGRRPLRRTEAMASKVSGGSEGGETEEEEE
jgi:hypothetical protein